jgi:subtilisin family serine protease
MIVLALISLALLAGRQDAVAINKLSPGLEARLQSSAPDESVTAVVFLQEQTNIADLDRQLRESRATRAFRHRLVIENLRATAERSQTRWREYLDQAKTASRLSGYRFYWIVNAVVLRAQTSFLYELSRNEGVHYMDVNLKPALIEPVRRTELRGRSTLDLNHGIPRGVRAINAPRVWRELGITGAGRLVANLDTGVDGGHPALAARWRGVGAPREQCWLDVNGTTVTPADGNGHGTHTMGTICGNSTTSNDSVGVAPGAQWIACRAIDQGGGSELDNDVLHAFQWFADPDENPLTIEDVPDVVSNSWGVSPSVGSYPVCFNFWNDVIINCEAAGVVVLFCAGNEGVRGLRSPATVALDSVTHFAVGAVDATNDTLPPYNIASFSSRGPSSCPPDTAVKPEVCAPGVDVYSCWPGGTYLMMSGTSMAAPHVAGIVALMREACPDADVREIKSILMRSAVDQGDAGNDNTFGFGVVDAFAAVQMLSGNITGTVTDAQTGLPMAGVTVRVDGSIKHDHTDSLGQYFIENVLRGSYSVSASKPRFNTATVQNVIVERDSTEIVDFALYHPEISLSAERIRASVTDQPLDTSFSIHNAGNGPLDYSISILFAGDENPNPWDSISGIPVSALTGDLQIMGCEFVGNEWWVTGGGGPGGQNLLYRFSRRGGFLGSIPQPSTTAVGWCDLACDSQYVYGSDDNNLVGVDHQGVVQTVIPSPVNPTRAVAYDPASDHFWVTDYTQDFYEIDRLGHIAQQIPNDGANELSVTGLAWNPWDANGFKLYIFSQNGVGSLTRVTRLHPVSQAREFVVDLPGLAGDRAGGCTITPAWNSTLLVFGAVFQNPVGDRLQIHEMTFNTTWIDVTPAAFEVPGNSSTDVLLHFDPMTLRPDTYRVNLHVRSEVLDTLVILPVELTVIPNGVDERAPGSVPTVFALHRNYPNPFNPTTTVRYDLPRDGQTRLTVYNLLGERVAELVNERQSAGRYEVRFEASDLPSGMYFYRLESGGFVQSAKMILMK